MYDSRVTCIGQTTFAVSIQVKVISAWSGETSWKIEKGLERRTVFGSVERADVRMS